MIRGAELWVVGGGAGHEGRLLRSEGDTQLHEGREIKARVDKGNKGDAVMFGLSTCAFTSLR